MQAAERRESEMGQGEDHDPQHEIQPEKAIAVECRLPPKQGGQNHAEKEKQLPGEKALAPLREALDKRTHERQAEHQHESADHRPESEIVVKQLNGENEKQKQQAFQEIGDHQDETQRNESQCGNRVKK